MKISLKELFDNTRSFIDFDYTTDLSKEEVFFEKPFQKPVRIFGRIENRAGLLTLSADIEAELTTHCSRCGKEITDCRSIPVEMTLVETGDEAADEMQGIYEVEREQDLDELLVPELILNMDMAVLCKEDCRGRCFKCGADLNEGECGCDRSSGLSPFAALKDLIK